MPKVIQNNNQTLSNNVSNSTNDINNNINNQSSNSSSHSILSSIFARLASVFSLASITSLLSSFILVLRHGLKKIKEFLGLFPYLRTLFPWRSSTFIKRSRQIRIVAFISCFAFVLLSFTILHPLSSPTQPTEAATGSSQSSSLTLDLASSSASVDLLVTDPEGSFAVSSSNAEFNVTTNNFTGYTLSIMSSNDEGLLTSTNGSSLSSITSAISLDTFAGSTSYNGKWGYRPSIYNAVANTSFLPSPTTTATTLDTTTAPNTSIPNYYTIEIGVRSDYTTASSSYTNTFIITAVSNPINYTISYNSNTSDNVTNMPSTQSSSTMATNIVLSSNIPVRDGYDFMGWCTVAPDTATPETCTGTTFQPGGDFGIDQTTLNNTTLYAMWQSQIIYMQDLTLDQCQAKASNSNITVVDSRDNNSYTVRYINGNCWMTQNLRLSGGRTLTSADSNVASSWYFPNTSLTSGNSNTDAYSTISSNTSYGGYYNFCAASAGTNCQDSTKYDTTYDICPKGWRLPTDSENYSIAGFYDSAFSPVYSGRYRNGSLDDTGSYGSWWSSTADGSSYQYYLYYYGGNLRATDYGNKYYGFSVRCVKGEPGTVTINFDGNGATGGSTASQQIAAGNTANLNTNGFTRTNYEFTGWNTAADGSGVSYSDQASYTVTPATGDATVTLYAQWEAIPIMQDFTLAQCRAQASKGNVTVVDSRDGSDYTVRYINGNCWMTENLRLSGGRTLTSADSNVASSWSFPSTSLTSGNSYTDAYSTISSNTSYGGYYNYCAASAGTVCSSSTTQNATYDICPKGWRLPTYSEQQGITSYSSAFSPVYSGYYRSGSLGGTGSGGYWWSSTANNNYNQYSLIYNSGSFYAVGYSKYYGFSVRCVRSS